MKFYRTTLTFILALFSTVTMAAAPQNLSELQQALNTIQQETGVPSIGVALVDSDGPVWVSAIGQADIEHQKPATADSIYRMGSVSKMFAGVAVMQLVDQGRLSLEDRLADLLPEFEFQNRWEETDPIRVVHLLEHTTGWDVHLGEYVGESPDSMSLEEGLNRHTGGRVSRWVPGTRQTYSNTGPVVAAVIVEKLTGMSFDEYSERHIFAPLGMDSSAFVKTQAFEERGVTGYTREGPTHYHLFHTRPSSSLNASPKDMANYLEMLINRGAYQGQQFLSTDAVTRMENGETTLGSNVGIHPGYGLTVDAFGYEDWNIPFYGHTGGIPGGVSEVIYQPELEAGYAFMMNQANREAFMRVSDTLRAYLLKDQDRREFAPQPLPEKFQSLNGFYVPVNPLSSDMKFMSDIGDVMRFETNETYLHRSPFFGGWKSSDYQREGASEDVLFSDWTGLPSVAIVHDPLLGETVQVEGKLYKKVSPVVVYGRLILLALSLILVISSFVYLAAWLLKRLVSRKQEKPGNKIRLVPAALSLLLLAIPLFFMVSGTDPLMTMQSTSISIFVFVVSLIYPLAVIAALYALYRVKSLDVAKGVYWYSATVVFAHAFLATYLGSYGFLAFRVWA
ncbi:serine hydrolase [Marinimicrobium sp. ABcell2]|uniref:serine hydrolase domain-containing protein n=1 Tax=Marinimicrobium sp. ABcell2 TaxID=3069751 RepID=UPI0027B12941|nr:serine hydrolase domain-containing protein [Marinimicrobium sp. ABcell2]MDQ2077008.1 serine hydrolase domain-containing protein [Marinimicrobium sp. ABcell2]